MHFFFFFFLKNGYSIHWSLNLIQSCGIECVFHRLWTYTTFYLFYFWDKMVTGNIHWSKFFLFAILACMWVCHYSLTFEICLDWIMKLYELKNLEILQAEDYITIWHFIFPWYAFILKHLLGSNKKKKISLGPILMCFLNVMIVPKKKMHFPYFINSKMLIPSSEVSVLLMMDDILKIDVCQVEIMRVLINWVKMVWKPSLRTLW